MLRGRVAPARALRSVDQRAVVVELAVVVAVFVGLQAYVNLIDAVVRPAKDLAEATTPISRHVAGTVVWGGLELIGLGAATVGYAAVRDRSLPVSFPGREAATPLAFATAGAAALAAVPLLPAALTFGVGPDHLLGALASAPANLVDRTAIFLAVFVAGMALLYHGFVQGAARRVFDRERAVVATTLLGAYFVIPGGVVPVGMLRTGPWLGTSSTYAIVATLVVLVLCAVVFVDERVDDGRVRTIATLPVVLAIGLAVVALVQAVDGPWESLFALTRVGVVGVAAYAYDRTDSLVAPALPYLAFALVSLVVQRAVLSALLAS